MTKKNKIRIKATAGLKDLDQLHKTLKSLGMIKNYSLTQEKFKQRGNTALHDMWVELTQVGNS
tara:strand:- start:358 stop:546 length:189 start_codon:yes stop_codon:yes gene_type:complete